MAAQTLEVKRFVRRTRLGPDEYRKNFRQLDGEVIVALTSAEADVVTPLMSKVYLRLANAPEGHWEREGVLRFVGREADGRWATAWEQLVALSGVSSATARKALRWMHEAGIVGYFAGKNGVGVRIFLNRASSSIGRRSAPGQKNLRLVRASTEAHRASLDEAAFSDSFADTESLETDLNPRAPKHGAGNTGAVQLSPLTPSHEPITGRSGNARTAHGTTDPGSADCFTKSLLARLEPAVRAAAAQAAAHEHERTREWLESRGLPKAARVAQREAYNVLRKCGLIRGIVGDSSTSADVGRDVRAPAVPHQLSEQEVEELAQACVAMLEVKGQSVESTLSEMSVAAGGFLLPEDTLRVRKCAAALLREARSEGASQ